MTKTEQLYLAISTLENLSTSCWDSTWTIRDFENYIGVRVVMAHDALLKLPSSVEVALNKEESNETN